jgi:hypothetical protein
MEEKPFNVGDRVVVIFSGGWGKFSHAPKKVSRIKRVMKLFVELEDSSKWKHWGGQHPRGDSWQSWRIEHATDKHLQQLRQRVLWGSIEADFKILDKHCESISIGSLKAIEQAMDNAVSEVPKEKKT